MNTTLNNLTAKSFTEIIGSRIASVNFTKKDGSERVMNVKLDVQKYSKGNANSTAHIPTIVTVFEMKGDVTVNRYRKIDLTRVYYK